MRTKARMLQAGARCGRRAGTFCALRGRGNPFTGRSNLIRVDLPDAADSLAFAFAGGRFIRGSSRSAFVAAAPVSTRSHRSDAVENAVGAKPPLNARPLRNLMISAQAAQR